MSDVERQIQSMVPRRTPRSQPRPRSGLAPLPPAHPFVSKQAQAQQAVDQVLHPHHRSIGEQIGGVFAGLPAGVVHFGSEAAQTVSGPARAAVDLFRGKVSPQDVYNLTQSNPFQKGSGRTEELRHKYVPLVADTIDSAEQTAGRLAQLTPIETASVGGHHVDTYGDKYRQGDIVNTALGDALNLSVAAGGAGKALGAGAAAAEGLGAAETAARLGKAADYAGVAERLGGRIANAPMEATGGVLKGAKSLWREGAQAAKESFYTHLPSESRLGRRVVRAATPEGRLLKQTAVAARSEPGRLSDWMTTNLAKDAGMIDEQGPWYNPNRLAKDAPSLHEQEVGLARAVGVSQADKMVSDLIGPDASLAAHVGPVNKQIPGQTLTREGQELAHQYMNGDLPAEQMARIDRVTAAYKKEVAENITPQAREGHGQQKLDPAQEGDAPLTQQVAIQLADRGVHQPDIDAAVQAVESGQATWDDLAARNPVIRQVLLDPDVHPAPWREAMNVLGQGAKAADEAGVAHNLPRTPSEMLAAGFERPTYMSGSKSSLDRPGRIQTTAVTEGFGGVRRISAEQHRRTLGHGQYSLATAAEALSKAASDAHRNAIIEDAMKRQEIPAAREILERPDKQGQVVDFGELRQEAEQQAHASNLGHMTPGQLDSDIQRRFGQSVLDELHQRGYDVLDGNRNDPQPGDFDPKTVPDPMKIGEDSIVLPLGLKDRLIPYRLGTDHNLLIALNTKGNSWFKRNVLPFNAHWTVGDMTSNLLMAWRAGAINPVEMFQAGRALKNLDPAAMEQMFNRPEFVDSGLKYQAAKALNPLLDDRPAARTPVGKAVRRGQEIGFNLNKLANRMQRHEYVYAKLQKELKSRGLSSVEDLGADSAKWQEPAVQKAVKDVVNDANNVLGTWDEMSPFEQRVATQVFPFWSWVRHITALVARTSIDTPTRVLWTLRVGALGMNTSPDDLPSFMQGSIANPFGNGRVNLNWANPFYDVGTGGLVSPGAAMRSTSPLIKLATTAATGRDLGRNLNTITHRPKTSPNQLAEALYGLTQASPFIRGAMNVAPTMDVPGLGIGLGPHRRYGSGQTILTPGTGSPADDQSRARMLANMFNIPLAQPDQVVPSSGSPFVRRSSGLRKSGLGSKTLKKTGV